MPPLHFCHYLFLKHVSPEWLALSLVGLLFVDLKVDISARALLRSGYL